jgi:biopolymer transport protein TolR
MGMAAGGGGGLQSEINVTPMVDIMLVLLIIFMVVTPMLQHGIQVNYPKDLNNPDEDQRIIKETSIVIAIVCPGTQTNPVCKPDEAQFYLGKQMIKKEQIKDKVDVMLKAIKKEEDKIVYIKSGIGVSYGDVVNVINEVRALGVDRIGLVADKKKGGAPAKPAA